MRATVIHGTRDVRVETVPDPSVQSPTDAVVRVTDALVCGSDLWPYRDCPPERAGARIGHEFVGVVTDVGADVSSVRPGDLVLAPFVYSDNTCPNCRNGVHTSCLAGGFWGTDDVDGGQGEAVRVPWADGTLVRLPADAATDHALRRSLLPLTDVLPTGHHAAVSAGVAPGSTVAVVGDGAVGLCGVLAARRLGAERVILLGRNEDRTALGRRFGATDVVADRGDAAVAAVRELTGGVGADSVLECVGTSASMDTAYGVVRDGGTVGWVGVPHLDGPLPARDMFSRNVGLRGGVAPVRGYLDELLPEVADGRLDPGPVLDLEVGLEDVPKAYAAMDDRAALKAWVRVSAP